MKLSRITKKAIITILLGLIFVLSSCSNATDEGNVVIEEKIEVVTEPDEKSPDGTVTSFARDRKIAFSLDEVSDIEEVVINTGSGNVPFSGFGIKTTEKEVRFLELYREKYGEDYENILKLLFSDQGAGIGSLYVSGGKVTSEAEKEFRDDTLSLGYNLNFTQQTKNGDALGEAPNDTLSGIISSAERIIFSAKEGNSQYVFTSAIISGLYGEIDTNGGVIEAISPQSGSYRVYKGYYLLKHFTDFIDKDWSILTDNTSGGRRRGDDGPKQEHSYATFTDASKDNVTIVFSNDTNKYIGYRIGFSEMDRYKGMAGKTFYCVESDSEGLLKTLGNVVAKNDVITIFVRPKSIMTLSTIAPEKLAGEGKEPLMTARSGDEELCVIENENMSLALGLPDSFVFNSKVTFNGKVNFDELGEDEVILGPEFNYVSIFARRTLFGKKHNGYEIRLYEDGGASLLKDDDLICEAKKEGFDKAIEHKLKLKMSGQKMSFFVDDEEVLSFNDKEFYYIDGALGITQPKNQNKIKGFKVTPLKNSEEALSVLDDSCDDLIYSEGWFHNAASSFRDVNKTVSSGVIGNSVSFDFEGTYLYLKGRGEYLTLEVTVDGVTKKVKVKDSDNTSIFYSKKCKTTGNHNVEIKVKGGRVILDSIYYK